MGTEAEDAGVTPVDAMATLLERFAEEFAFLMPGTADGVLPVNALLMDLEQLPGIEADPIPAQAIEIARRWMDQVLDGDGFFSASTIQNLHAWHDWFLDHLLARETGRPIVPMPVQWRLGDSAVSTAVDHRPQVKESASAIPTPEGSQGPNPHFSLRLPSDLELLQEFHIESLELLRSIEQSVLELESGTAGPDVVNAVFRAFHTFKGSAGFLQLEALRDFAHELESLLEEVRSGRLAVGRRVIDAILAGADALAGCIAQVGIQVSGAEPTGPIEISAGPVLTLIKRALDREPDADVAPSVSTSPQATETQPQPVSATHVERNEAVVRVDAAKLDAMVNLVGELVITQAYVLENQAQKASENLDLDYAIRKLTRITRELQHNALSMRMVPISGLFRKMSRLVRDLAASLGKQARLQLDGEDTELDRHLVEQMQDPLVHMIRNALDHGVEKSDQRIRDGKDPVATIRLSASHAHGGVLIQVADDGRGINGEALKKRALEKGLIDPRRELSDPESLALIFLPGLSTAAAVTEVSGRGVGMDVVKGHIEALRGHVGIQTELGRGTTFSIQLPLTLSQIDGFLIGVAGERYILAAAAVRECFRHESQLIASVHERSGMVSVRGRQIPLLRLANCLSLAAQTRRTDDGIVVLLETSVGTRAILVDEVLGKQEVIIKNLGDTFAKQSLITGGAILADGRVALILDAETLARQPVDGYTHAQRDLS